MSTNPQLLSIATAVPQHVFQRDAIMAGAKRAFDGQAAEMDRLMPIYANAGVDQRYFCMPLDWYFQPHGWAERNRLFLEHALALMESATRDCLDAADLAVEDIDAIVAVSSSGIATPSLDALLMDRMGMRADVMRLPVFGLGCAGGVLGLARAAATARAHPGARVLLVVVELCGLTFRVNDQSKSNIVATALFGDGAAAVLLGPGTRNEPVVTAWGEHRWPGSLDVMGWQVEDDGMAVIFSHNIPALVAARFRPALDAFLAGHNLSLALIDRFLCHPGGAKVVVALEQALDLPDHALAHEREVLRLYGNMSAATVLFVLQRGLAQDMSGRTLVSGLGPGFTAGFVLIEAA